MAIDSLQNWTLSDPQKQQTTWLHSHSPIHQPYINHKKQCMCYLQWPFVFYPLAPGPGCPPSSRTRTIRVGQCPARRTWRRTWSDPRRGRCSAQRCPGCGCPSCPTWAPNCWAWRMLLQKETVPIYNNLLRTILEKYIID